MREPVLSFDVAMGGDSDGWHQLGDYALWTFHRGGAEPFQLWEMRAGRPAAFPLKSHAYYNVEPGVPHRLAPLYGFWRISSGDTDILKAADDDGAAYTILINTGAPQFGTDRVAWFCETCGTLLAESAFDVKRHGIAAYWEHARTQVAAFNADQARRTCSACGAVHQDAYDFAPRMTAPW